MSAMDRFLSQGDDEPWFRVGTVDVTSSVLVAGLCAVSMLVYAIDKTALGWLWLLSDGGGFGGAIYDGVRQGQVWRLVTWPMFNPPDIWTFVDIVVIWYFGRELERHLGRRRYLWFLAVVVVLPAVGYVLVVPTLIAPTMGVVGGAFFLSSAVVIAFIATYPGAQFFFGIPFWIVAVVFEAITVLQLVGDRVWDGLWFLLLLAAVALVGARSFGLSDLEWIPRVPLPAALREGGAHPAQRSQRRRQGGRRRPATVTPIRPPNATPTSAELLRQAEIDILLDKINEHGIGSLTPEERRRLDEHSRRMRDER
jgi:membrane associated rhomboid family serine protease